MYSLCPQISGTLGRSRGYLNSLSSAVIVQHFGSGPYLQLSTHFICYTQQQSNLPDSPELWCPGKASNICREHARRGKDKAGVTVPLLEPQALPCCERLGSVLQHPEFVEQHHIENDQQHQTANKEKKQFTGSTAAPLPACHTWGNIQSFNEVSGAQVHAEWEWEFNLCKVQVIRTQNFTMWERCVSKDRQTGMTDG